MSKTVKALPDSARKQKVKAKEMVKQRVNKTRTDLDKLMGSQAQLPCGLTAGRRQSRDGERECETVNVDFRIGQSTVSSWLKGGMCRRALVPEADLSARMAPGPMRCWEASVFQVWG